MTTADRGAAPAGRHKAPATQSSCAPPVTNRPQTAPVRAGTHPTPTPAGVRARNGATMPRRPATQQTDTRNHLHDVDSAADYLRCGRRLIYRLVAERRIRFTKAGRSLRFWQSCSKRTRNDLVELLVTLPPWRSSCAHYSTICANRTTLLRAMDRRT